MAGDFAANSRGNLRNRALIVMATRSDTPDPAVDELRRKARRRLVGAVVLALAAAVLLPLLLENEPKPLGDDVSIQIPPVDTGKFVNPLSPAAPPDGRLEGDKGSVAGSQSGSAPTPPPAASEPPKTEPPKTEPPKTEAPLPNVTPPGAKAPAPAAGVGPSETVTPRPNSVAPAAESKPDAKAASGAEAKSNPVKATGPFVVQVAAFSDRYGARSLVAKLKQGGFPGYTETVTTDKGTLHRVRVGPYPSREVADAARAKLKAAGFAGVVARNG